MKIIVKKGCGLTPKELDTIKWWPLGKTNWEISKLLNVAEQTTANRTTSILKKLDATNRTHGLAVAILKGIISLHTLIFAILINASDIDQRRGARRPSRRKFGLAITSYGSRIVDPYYIPKKKA